MEHSVKLYYISRQHIKQKVGKGLYVLSGELRVSQAFLARLALGGGYMDVCELVVFYDCGL